MLYSAQHTLHSPFFVFRNFANAPENGLLSHLLPYPEGRTDPHKLVRWSMSEKCLRRLRNEEGVKAKFLLMKVFREPGY